MNFYKNLINLVINEENPSNYLLYLKNNNYICHIYELANLIGIPQESDWHPEGDVWTHTLLVVDGASNFKDNFYYLDDYIAFMIGALCHDFGKPYTTIWDKNRIRSPKHDLIGAMIATNFAQKIGLDAYLQNKVYQYVMEHLRPMQLFKIRNNLGKDVIPNLQKRIHIPDLVLLAKADHFGRTTDDAIAKQAPHCDWLLSKYYDFI